MKFNKYILIGTMALSLGMTSCVGDLDVKPDDPNTKLELAGKEEFLGVLARAYGGLVLEGGISVDDGEPASTPASFSTSRNLPPTKQSSARTGTMPAPTR